jgi:hypothetical protein
MLEIPDYFLASARLRRIKKGLSSMFRSLLVATMVAVLGLSVGACTKAEEPEQAEQAAPAEGTPEAPDPAPDKPET